MRTDCLLNCPVSRSPQAAKTYLERSFDRYPGASMDALIKHALKALQASVADGELKKESVSLAVVGKDMPLTILEDDAIEAHIVALKVRCNHTTSFNHLSLES